MHHMNQPRHFVKRSFSVTPLNEVALLVESYIREMNTTRC